MTYTKLVSYCETDIKVRMSKSEKTVGTRDNAGWKQAALVC